MAAKRRSTGWERNVGPATDRPTLITCEHCGGAGKVEHELMGPGTYMMRPCVWCDGLGAFTRSRMSAYRRWKRIRIRWERDGLCRTT